MEPIGGEMKMKAKISEGFDPPWLEICYILSGDTATKAWVSNRVNNG